jgi:hypothetical protein
MKAIDGAVSHGAEVRVSRAYHNGSLKYAAELHVGGRWQSTHYGKTTAGALEGLERYLGSLAIMGAKRLRRKR